MQGNYHFQVGVLIQRNGLAHPYLACHQRDKPRPSRAKISPLTSPFQHPEKTPCLQPAFPTQCVRVSPSKAPAVPRSISWLHYFMCPLGNSSLAYLPHDVIRCCKFQEPEYRTNPHSMESALPMGSLPQLCLADSCLCSLNDKCVKQWQSFHSAGIKVEM